MRYPVFALDLVLLGLITLAIVVSLQAIGNILVLAMLVTPAATARLLTHRLVDDAGRLGADGAACGVVGLYISFWWNVASGGAMVLTTTAVFFVVFGAVELGGIGGARRRRPRSAEREPGAKLEGDDGEAEAEVGRDGDDAAVSESRSIRE